MKIGNFPRKKYIVDNLQYRLLLTSLLYVLAVVLVFGTVLFAPLMVTLEGEAVTSPAAREAAHQFLAIHQRVWLPVLCLVGLLVIHNILFSHRIAGPLYRIRHELRKIGDGNLYVQVRLRKNDYLDKEAESINEMVGSLRAKIRSIEHNQKKASAVLVELQRALIRGSADDMTDQLDHLGGILVRLKESVDQFQIPREPARSVDVVATPDHAKSSSDLVGAGTSKGS